MDLMIEITQQYHVLSMISYIHYYCFYTSPRSFYVILIFIYIISR